MSVTKEVIDAECKLVIRVTGASLAKKENLEAILTDLNQALTALEEEMASSRHYFFQISLEVDGVAPKAGAFNPYETAEGTIEPNDPWCSFCPEFWDKALSEPELRLDVKKFVKRFNSILRKVVKTAHSPPSELDEVQLGEPLLAHLAHTARRQDVGGHVYANSRQADLSVTAADGSKVPHLTSSCTVQRMSGSALVQGKSTSAPCPSALTTAL